MTNNQIRDKIVAWLSVLRKDFELGNEGLLKSERLHLDKSKVEDEIFAIKDSLSEIEKLRFEKIKPLLRNEPKTGFFLTKEQVLKDLTPLNEYVHFLFEQYFRVKIKQELEDEQFWVKTQIDGEDTHLFIGDKNDSGKKVHLISDGGTGELRIDPKDVSPHDLLAKVTTIIEMKSGKKIQSTRTSLEFIESDETNK